jgi:hypothetical protein
MNLFILDTDPIQAARDHCDNHLVKMILEGAQILGSTMWIQNGITSRKEINALTEVPDYWNGFPRQTPEGVPLPYGIGFANHPSSKWTRSSYENWKWTVDLCVEMSFEHERRWGRVTSMRKIVEWFASHRPPGLAEIGITPFYLAMPDQIKTEDPVHSYRLYYAGWKEYFAKWKSSEPSWWNEYLEIVKTQKELYGLHPKVISRIENGTFSI